MQNTHNPSTTQGESREQVSQPRKKFRLEDSAPKCTQKLVVVREWEELVSALVYILGWDVVSPVPVSVMDAALSLLLQWTQVKLTHCTSPCCQHKAGRSLGAG